MRCRYNNPHLQNDYFELLEECEVVQDTFLTSYSASKSVRMVVAKRNGQKFNVYVSDFEGWDGNVWVRLEPKIVKKLWKGKEWA